MRRIIYDGDSFYELDEDCMKEKEDKQRRESVSGTVNNEETKIAGISRCEKHK